MRNAVTFSSASFLFGLFAIPALILAGGSLIILRIGGGQVDRGTPDASCAY